VGFLDDASKNPWGELVKGLLDLALVTIAAISFVVHNSTDVTFFGMKFHIPMVLYVILAIALIWGSVNVTNCSDGVDGLCGTVTVIEIIAYSLIFGKVLGIYAAMSIVLAFVLVGYLSFNWNPSTVLMGDAGSRPIGFILALLAMKSGHPFVFILLSFVFLFDGGLGLLKLALLRTVKISLFKNILLPFHDHLRKRVGWKIPKIVIFFSLAEIVFAIITAIIMKIFGV
jgi:phospho-N-acetylmuramoyl-pentapeptide-transferase